jgi:hypothetical protein
MQVSVKRWRVAKVSLAELRAAAGVAEDADGTAILTGLRQSLGPLGPRIKFFFPDADNTVHDRMKLVIAGIEVEAFDVRAEGIPFAGVVHADPMDSIDMAREEGALRAELERIGLRVEVEKLEWRFSYEVKE